jgi:hypothetical protein
MHCARREADFAGILSGDTYIKLVLHEGAVGSAGIAGMAKGIVLLAPPEGTQRVFPAPLAIQLAGKNLSKMHFFK